MPELYYDRSYYVAELEVRRQRASSIEENSKRVLSGTAVIAPASADSHSTKWTAYKPFSGSKSDQSIFVILFRPFLHLSSPAVIWGALTFSVVFNLLPMISVIYSQLFSAAPYNFSTGAVGIISGVPGLIGTLIGTAISGPLSDWSAKSLAKRNGGVYEPEFRLVPMLPFCVLGGMGLYGWGMQTSDSWVVPAVFITILHAGVSCGTISCIGYVSDFSGKNAADAVAIVVLVKSVIGVSAFDRQLLSCFQLTVFIPIQYLILTWINAWLAKVGTYMFMVSLGSLAVAVAALSIPAWVLGKRARVWYATTRFGRLGA